MPSVIAYIQQDGTVAIITPILENNYFNPNTNKWFSRLPGDEVPAGYREATIQDIAAKDVPTGVYPLIMDSETIPTDSTFRAAWRLTDRITVDMPIAKDIWMNLWRTAREPLLKALDVDFMRSLEADDLEKKAEVVAKKNALRDVTTTDLSAVSTPEELKAVWPDILNG